MRKTILSNIIMIISAIILILFCISLLLPFFWMLITSFKDPIDYILNTFGWPTKMMFSNYPSVIELLSVTVVSGGAVVEYKIWNMLLFSLIIAVVSGFMNVFVPTITAYIVSKYNFKAKRLIYNVAIIVMIIPIVGNLPSALRVTQALGIYNNIIPYLVFTAGPFGFNFILMYGAFKSLSWSYAEAAFIDGAGHFTVMFRIMFPMIMPTFSTLFILGFIAHWNDYMVPITFLPSYPNLAYGMYNFQLEASRIGAAMPEILAGFVIVSIPTCVMYLGLQRFGLKNVRMGGLKG
ncbi:MAG: carbohydrate ABC transporter permease [Clostridia bacterium]|nr:carbohydrate ABC transporter permease [Clostridia bacterium]